MASLRKLPSILDAQQVGGSKAGVEEGIPDRNRMAWAEEGHWYPGEERWVFYLNRVLVKFGKRNWCQNLQCLSKGFGLNSGNSGELWRLLRRGVK